MRAAIYFVPEGYTTAGPKLMGRNAAGESFLRGFLSYSRSDEFWLQVAARADAELFAQAARAAGRTEPIKVVEKQNLAQLSHAQVVYHPGPGIGQHAWQRAAFGHERWSLCGITHTTASARAMDSIADLLLAPTQAWDALICTSNAVKEHVLHLLNAQSAYLQDRLHCHAPRLTQVLAQLPVIPLGIHTQDFVFDEQQKSAARAALGVDQDTLAVLFVGRLSFHAKAHPLAMYQALESAAGTLPPGKKVVLIECGWHASEYIAQAFASAAQLACPSVRVIRLDGRRAAERQIAWASGDIYCSLSDNIQETFGISPIEAMAAGLPVVVSDWDGYRDSVRDGIDGIRIPTIMPHAGLGEDLALRHALEIDTYDLYCGHTCSLIAVDVAATTQAFTRLFASAELRQRMGAAARQRAQQVYDWKVIIPQYEALWAQLNELRSQAQAHQLKHPWPARIDPFSAFANYATHTLELDRLLELAHPDALAALAQWRSLTMVNFAQHIMPSESECQMILQQLATGPQSVHAVVQSFPAERRSLIWRALVWLIKLGVIRLLAQVNTR